MIQKILIIINNLLYDTFVGLDESKIFGASFFTFSALQFSAMFNHKSIFTGYTEHELMMPIISPRSKPPPQLGAQATYGDWNSHSAKKFCTFAVPTISSFMHCCSMMLTRSYPIQVNIPVPAVVTFMLLTDITFHKSLLQPDAPFHQEVVFSEILALHSSFLDLLGAIITGMRRCLEMIVGKPSHQNDSAEGKFLCFAFCFFSTGMGLHLLQVVVSNISADLDDNFGSSLFILSKNPIGAVNQSSSKRSSSNNQTFHGQSSIAGSQPTCIRKSMPSLCVKIAILETFEVLLNVGGSFRACY